MSVSWLDNVRAQNVHTGKKSKKPSDCGKGQGANVQTGGRRRVASDGGVW